jgi:hypothetical protein
VGITSSEKDIQTPQAKIMKKDFDDLHGWWYKVTLTRDEPEGSKMRVKMRSSKYDQEGYVWGGKRLGKWWLTDTQVAEGESKEAIEKVRKLQL